MVKLIRLTTENDGKFAVDLDAGIEVEQKGQIAVQNLTFETDFNVLEVNGRNNKIIVQWNANSTPIATPIEAYLNSTTYSMTNIHDIFADVGATLNGTQVVVYPTNDEQECYGEFRCQLDQAHNKTEIDYKLSPLCLPFHQNDDAEVRHAETTQLFDISRIHAGLTSQASLQLNNAKTDGGINLGNIKQASATSADTDELKNFIYPMDPCGCLSRGAGVWFCNINNLVDNTGASDTNGFGIGLSFTDIETLIDENNSNTIPTSARDFEIRCKKPADDFTYFTPANPGVAQTSTGNAPYKYDISVDTNPATHDLMMLERQANDIVGSVLNIDGGATGQKIEIFRYPLNHTQRKQLLHPYLYVCGAEARACAGHPTFTPLVIDDNNMDYETTGRSQVLTIAGSGAPARNCYDLYRLSNAVYANVLPQINNDMLMHGQPASQNLKITMNNQILHTLGYHGVARYFLTPAPYTWEYPTTDINANNVNASGFTLTSASAFSITNSDNYVLMIDSNPVMSYDASQFNYDKRAVQKKEQNHRGRRLNILATIPVNDNTSGVVEFQANELVYIDLDNKFPQTLKNLRLRVLDKNLQEIVTIGTSVLTLLIKG